jgi:hypothetical protein
MLAEYVKFIYGNSDIVGMIGIWYLIAQLLDHYNKNFKLSRMNVSALNALTVIIFYLCNLSLDVLYTMSVGYYIMDTIYEVRILSSKTRVSLYEGGIIIHHIISVITLGYLLDSYVSSYVFYAYFISEVSNLPMYLAYQLIHLSHLNKMVIGSVTLMEIAAFLYLRMYLGGIMAYNLWFDPNVPIFINISSVAMLIISFVWIIKLSLQAIKKKDD